MGEIVALGRKHRRPEPPHLLTGFKPSGELEDWAKSVFVKDGAPLLNRDHAHLRHADIGFLWAGEVNVRAMRRILGQTELMPPQAFGTWQKGRAIAQLMDWFGSVPDFLITLDCHAAREMDDASFCALVEHELYHCGQKVDAFGMPKFRQDGSPQWAIRGHDVEEFVGVVARYGTHATRTEAMVKAGSGTAEVATAAIALACGTCHRRAA